MAMISFFVIELLGFIFGVAGQLQESIFWLGPTMGGVGKQAVGAMNAS